MRKIFAITLISLFIFMGTSCGTFFNEPAPTATPEPTLSVDKNGIPLDIYPTLAFKVERTEEFKQLLAESGCREENLDFCADLLYARDDYYGAHGFLDDRFDLMDRTVLANYLSEEEIYNFGRTGEGLEVVYFKDENGNNTNIPAICYVGGDETEHISLDQLQGCIDFWINNGATNFLEAMVDNDVRIIFQNQASSKEGGGHCVFKYGSNIILCNSAQVDGAFITMLTKAIAVEQFGVRGDSFGYDLGINEVSVLKSRLARDCSLYMVKKFGVDDELLNAIIDAFETENEKYMGIYLPEMSSEEFEELVQDVKDKGIFEPFVPATWEEIDAVIAEE